MGGVVKAVFGGIGSLFGGGGGGDSGSAAAQAPAPVPPPIAPPAYTNPHAADGAGAGAPGNVSNSARAAGAFSDTIITGPEGIKEKESTSNTSLKSTLGS